MCELWCSYPYRCPNKFYTLAAVLLCCLNVFYNWLGHWHGYEWHSSMWVDLFILIILLILLLILLVLIMLDAFGNKGGLVYGVVVITFRTGVRGDFVQRCYSWLYYNFAYGTMLLETTSTANLRTTILDFRGFDSSVVLSLSRGIRVSIDGYPENIESTSLSRDRPSREIGHTCCLTSIWNIKTTPTYKRQQTKQTHTCCFNYIYIYI